MKRKPMLLVGLVLAGCSQTMVEDRPGATAAQARADHQACHDKVKDRPEVYMAPQPTLAGAAAVGAVTGALGVIQEERLVKICMARLGYVDRDLTPEEAKAVNAAPSGPARDAALDAVMRAND